MCGCVSRGVGRKGRFHFLRQQSSTQKCDKERERKERKAECFGVTILLLIALTVSVVQNMTLPSLSHDRNTGDWINTILCSD